MWMKSHRLGLRITLMIGVAMAMAETSSGREDYLSPLALAADRDGKNLYIAEATAGSVAVFDVAGGKAARRIALPSSPEGLVLSPDGSRLYVTGGAEAGEVFIVNTASGKVTGKIAAGHTPMAPVLSPDGKSLYVCNRFNNDVSVIDLAAGKEVARIAVSREPIAAAVTGDGALLFVANHLPGVAATSDVVAACVSVIDLKAMRQTASLMLPNGSTSLRGLCISPDGRYVYVTHTLGRYQIPTTQLERGWMNTSALSVIEVAGRKLVNTVLLDDVDLGGANPWGVACSADGRLLCVTHAGTHELSVIDRAALHEKLDKAALGQRVNDVTGAAADVPNDLSFLVGLRRRIKLAGNGPRGLIVLGRKAFAAEYYSDSVAVVDIESSSTASVRSLALGPKVPLSPVRKGEMLFNDAGLCFQQWQSCASCHPDSRADGLNWDLLNDGIGNPKNTKSMLLAHATPPVMSLAVREDAEYAVRSGIKFILFAVRPDEDAKAIDEYLKAMKPVPSPRLTRNGKLTPAAKRGKAVFDKAGCAACHSGPYHTDMKAYKIGTGTGMDKDKAFDTPALVEVWRTAPYLHDGRAGNLQDLLTVDNPNDQHGSTRGLSKDELNDLVEYVLSL